MAEISAPPNMRPHTIWRDIAGDGAVLIRRVFEFKSQLYVTYRYDAQMISVPADYFTANFTYLSTCHPLDPAFARVVAQDRLVAEVQAKTLPAILYILQHPDQTHEVNEAAKQYALLQADEYGIKDFIDARLVVRDRTAEVLLEGVGPVAPDFWSRLGEPDNG
jgi:hypothetical protein